MTRRELRRLGSGGIWEQLVGTRDDGWLDLVAAQPGAPEDWRGLARRGGFPVPAVHQEKDLQRRIWFDGYVQTYLERDLQGLSSITALPDFRRLVRAACLQLGQIVNQTRLGREVSLPQATVHRYLNLLETSYLLVRLPAYAPNRGKRVSKLPKLYWSDTGLALNLAQQEEPGGAHLENIVLRGLLCWRDAPLAPAELMYWRPASGVEGYRTAFCQLRVLHR